MKMLFVVIYYKLVLYLSSLIFVTLDEVQINVTLVDFLECCNILFYYSFTHCL